MSRHIQKNKHKVNHSCVLRELSQWFDLEEIEFRSRISCLRLTHVMFYSRNAPKKYVAFIQAIFKSMNISNPTIHVLS